jgi:outer membrane protein OmpA-like peptidoglycan-associated protein
MKKHTISVLALLLFVGTLFSTSLAQAQDKDHPWAASVSLLTHQYSGDFGSEVFQFQSDSDFGFNVGLSRYLTNRLNLRLDYTHANIDYNLSSRRDAASQYPPTGPNRFETATNMLRLGLTFDLLQTKNNNFAVYALAGVGAAFTTQSGDFSAGVSDESVMQVPLSAGLGFNKKVIGGSVVWNVELAYQFLTGNEKDNFEGTPTTNGVNGQFDGTDADGFLLISTGLKIGLSGKKDMDGDGISDKNDACPNVPGLKEFRGCPDTDGDGIIDSEDNCPTVAGEAILMGCPDKDQDGVTDSEDACPDVAGLKSLKGCPDADGDGVTDSEDACPDVAGPKATMGCPDADGDGVTDSEDACPDVAGPMATMGCPDADGDGILDANDSCPNAAGIALFDGCDKYTYYLDFDDSEIPLNVITTLNGIADYLKENAGAMVIIEGHADNEGTPAYNESLSKRRAKVAIDYLTKKGVSANKMQMQAYGESKPVEENDTEAGRAKNRRVVLRIDQ